MTRSSSLCYGDLDGRLGGCSFVATLLPGLGAVVDHEGLRGFFAVIAVMLWLVASMITASAWARLAAHPHPAEVRDIRNAKLWLVAGALSFGLPFALFWGSLGR